MSNEDTLLPPAPASLHWLGDIERAHAMGHADDTRGCVMFFTTQDECIRFIDWVKTLPFTQPARFDGEKALAEFEK